MDRILVAPKNPLEQIHIPNQSILLSKLKKFIQQGVENLEIVTDYDMTFTRYKVNDVKGPSTYQLLQSSVLIGQMASKIHELYEYYHPIEINPDIPYEVKEKHMNE